MSPTQDKSHSAFVELPGSLQHSSTWHGTLCSDLLGHLSVTGSEQHPQCCLSVSNYGTVFVTQRSKTNRFKVPPSRQHFLQSTKMCKGMTGPSSRAESVNALAHRSDSICRNPQEQPKNLIKKEKKKTACSCRFCWIEHFCSKSLLRMGTFRAPTLLKDTRSFTGRSCGTGAPGQEEPWISVLQMRQQLSLPVPNPKPGHNDTCWIQREELAIPCSPDRSGDQHCLGRTWLSGSFSYLSAC